MRNGVRWTNGSDELLPVYESRLVHQYDHRYGSYNSDGEVRELSPEQRNDFSVSVEPRYWVRTSFFESLLEKYNYRQSYFIAYRDVTRATDVRTVLASVIPKVPAAVTLPVLGIASEKPGYAILANLNAMVLDYVARQKVGGIHLTFGMLKQLPILPPESYSEDSLSFIRRRVVELTFTSNDLSSWARALGHSGPPFRWEPDRRAVLRAELDAWYAQAYGLTRDELRYILDPADVMGADWPSETFRVLKTNEERQFGEYRTRRLVLEAWDALVAGRPMPSTITSAVVNTQLAHDFTGPPAATPDVARAMTIIALVRAATRPLAVIDLARAFALRAKPSEVPALVPPEFAADVTAWAKVASADSVPAGVVDDLVNALVDREALQWHLADGAPRAVGASTHAPTWEELDPWYQSEATLLLRVLATLTAAERATVDAAIPAADRTLRAERSA